MSNTPLPSSFDDAPFHQEGRYEKFTRRIKEEPLVPFGCLLTCYALFRASQSMRKGDHNTTNRMFRARIYAQGFTILCMVAGAKYYGEERSKRKEFEGTIAEKKAAEKRDAWIRELEARDEEEKEIKAKQRAVRRAQSEVAKSILERSEARSSTSVTDAVRGLLWR